MKGPATSATLQVFVGEMSGAKRVRQRASHHASTRTELSDMEKDKCTQHELHPSHSHSQALCDT